LRLEFAQFGIDVILIEPGAMKTGIFSTVPGGAGPQFVEVAGA
jgi:hypothetical protein